MRVPARDAPDCRDSFPHRFARGSAVMRKVRLLWCRSLTRQRQYGPGSRPHHLGGGRIPAQRNVRQHEVFQERLERSPVLVVRHFKRQMAARGCRSIREFARRTGRDHSVVARYLRVLNLPDEIIGFPEENQTPEVLRHFTVKRLDALARMPATDALRLFRHRATQATRHDRA